MNFRDFMKPRPEPTPDEKEFRDWMKKNRDHFKEGDYSAEEVGYFAGMNGFDPVLIYRELSHFQDALNGSYIDNRAALKMFQFDGAVETFRKMSEDLIQKAKTKERRKLGIDALWRDVVRHQGRASGGKL